MKPMRMCVVCRKGGEKSEFIRLVRNKAGEFRFSEGHMEGRGAYVCKEGECKAKVVKTRAFNRSFKMNVPSEIYEQLN